MKTKMWKKILSLALALVMAATLLPEPAWAAVAHDAPEWGEAIAEAAESAVVRVRRVFASSGKMPSDTYSFLEIVDRGYSVDQDSTAWPTLYHCSREESTWYSDSTISYDKVSNTLTLNNYSGEEKFIAANRMGDLTINVIGTNTLDGIFGWGDRYGTSYRLIGNGTLNLTYNGLQISGELSDCAISIGDELTLTSQYAGGSAIFIGQSASASGITLPANIDGLRVETFRYYLTTTINDTSYRLYTKGDAYYGSFQVGETYSLFLLNKDGNTYTIANNDPVLSGVTEIPAEYEIYYSDYYRYKVVSEDGGDLNSVTISPSGTTVQGAPTIHTDAVLPNGFVGRTCVTVLSATPYTENAALAWSLDSGSLPDGLTLNSDGTFSGTFAKAGTYTFSAVVNETDGGIAMRQFTIIVKETTIATTSLKTAAYGVSYSATLTATPSNGGAITWAVTAGNLPEGLTLNATTGVISGKPTANGDSTFTVTATEAGGGIASKEFTLTVAEAKTVTYDLNGGTAASGASYDPAAVPSGAVIALPAAPTKSDEKGALTFAGWKVTSGGQAQGYTYNAGNAFTVTEDVTFTAQWERELKADYTGQVIGWVGLYGVKGRNSTSLWGEYYDTVQSSVRAIVPVWQMRDCEYDRLDLHATVDGEDTVIASYNNTVDQTTGTVTLTGANNYTVLNGVTVTGLTRETDYYLSSVVHHTAASANKNIYLYDSPILVSTDGTYTVELSGVKGSANYDKYDWSESKTGLLLDASGKLTVTPTPISATATVTGTVTVNGDTRSGVIVTATQIVGGVSRSVSATTEYENGTPRYTLHLIPNCAATFAASYQGQQLSVTGGATLAADSVASNTPHAITAISNTLSVTITPDTKDMNDAEKKLADSYLRSLVHKSYSWYGGENYITVTSGGSGKTANISVRSASGTTADVSLDFIKTTDATLSVSANVPGLAAMSDNSVALSGSRATVTFTPALTPGVVVDLSATRTASVFTVWYDRDGVYKGKSETFTLSSIRVSWGIPCPAQDKTGAFKIVLLPASYDGCVENLSFSELPAKAELTHWDTTLTAGRVTDLGAYSLSAAASDNAVFVTKPGSTMTASAQSFSSESDLIAFTGRIGLDDGCRNGKLTVLYANMGNSAHWEAVSAIAKQLVIDGKSYPSPGSSVNGVYTFDLKNENISLPCDYTLYCTPGSIAWEMDVSLSADVAYDGGSDYKQLIGRAVVEKPGAYITTLSTYVCDEQIAVEGTAKPNEAVTIYDNGAAVGTATADQYGDWTAIIDLNGTDTKYVTTHRVHSVSASGVASDEMTVFHQPGGAQLTGFTMTYSSYGGGITSVNRTVNVGDAYIANTLGLSDVSFTVTVKNPDQLTVLPEGFNCPVTVKVYTNDGQIRFVPATQTKTETVDGATIATFVADVGDVPALVSGAEAMMLPITKTIPDTTKFSLYADDMADMDGELAELLTALNDELSTNFEDAAAALTYVADKTSNDNVTVTFAADGTPTGAPSMSAEQLNDLKTCAKELGLKKATIEYDVSESTMEWLDTIGAELANQVGADGKYYEIQNLHASASTLEKAITDTKGRATELLDTGNLTVDGKNSRLAMYALSGDGYDVMFSFMSAEGMYLETVSASFTGEFEGFGRTFAVTPAQRRLFAEQGPASDAHLTATGYAALVLADAYADALYQRNLQEMESGDHGAVLNTFNKVVDQIAEDPAGNGSLYLGVLTSLTPEALWAQIVSQLAGVSVGASIGLSAVKDAFESAQKDWEQYEQMEVDLRELRNMPCYQVMNPTRKEICQDYYLKFSRASAAWTYITILVLIAFFLTSAASLGLAVGSFIPGFGLGSFALSLFTGLGAWALGSFGMNYAESWFTKTVDAYRNCYMKTAQFIRITAQEYEGDDCKEKKKYNDGINGKTSMGQTHDPSGIVYEGVLENPVEGATATLYYASDGGNNLVKESNSNSATQLLVADGVRGVTPGDPVQTTGGDGMFQWFVPEGLWFVTAEKGTLTGNSNGDIAATVDKSVGVATKLLPVLPPQLNVNIPLVDAATPYVTDVQYKTDGIYVTFSKYMVDDQTGGSNYTASVLNPANYSVYSVSADTVVSVVSIEQGSTPANRGTPTTSYTRTVKLTTNGTLTAGDSVTLTVNNTKSYAGTQMASYASDGVVTVKQTLAAPTFSGATSAGAAFSGSTVKALMNRGGGLTITAETGTKIYYTTDGSIPTVDASGAPQGTTKLYTSPIAVSGSMTVRAIAVKIGYTASGVATAEITQRAVGTRSDGSPVSVDPTPAPAPTPTPTPSGTRDADPGSSSVTVPVSGGAGTVNLNVTVNGGTAQVAPISDADVARVVGTGGGNVNVVMDLSSLGGKIETVSIPDASFDKLSNALEAHNGSDSLTVKTANGSVKLSENAASAVADASNAGNVALTIKNSGESGLNAAQKAAVADKNVAGAYDLGVTANGRDVGVLGGGFAEVNVPFTPEAGASALDYRVYRVDENSNIALVPSAVHDGKLTVRSDRLDDLVVVYEPTNETFADVADDAYYADAVAWALSNGVTNGMGDNLFAPDDVCTRAQVVTFLWRAAGAPQPKNKASGFADVAADTWYSDAVAWAAENGITNGVGDNLFGVDEICTRAQVVTFLCRMSSGRASGRNPFVDVEAGAYYYDAVLWAYANGVTNGTGDDRYSPDALCTRAQIVTFLYRDFSK